MTGWLKHLYYSLFFVFFHYLSLLTAKHFCLLQLTDLKTNKPISLPGMRYILTLILLAFFLTGQSQVTQEAEVITVPRQIQLPYNRLIQPAGIQITFGDASVENHALDVALSPDRKWLAVEERSSIVFISTSDNTVKYVLRNSSAMQLRGGIKYLFRNNMARQ